MTLESKSQSIDSLKNDTCNYTPLPVDFWSKYQIGDDVDTDCPSFNRVLESNDKLLVEALFQAYSTVGNWNNMSFEQFIILVNLSPITGGLTNLIFSCSFEPFIKNEPRYTFASRERVLEDIKNTIGEKVFLTLSSASPSDLNPTPTKVIIRIYGTSLLARREIELEACKVASAYGITELLYSSWKRGRVTSFLEGTTLSSLEWNDIEYIGKGIKLVGQFHATPIPDSLLHSDLLFDAFYLKWYEIAQGNKLYKETMETKTQCPSLYDVIENDLDIVPGTCFPKMPEIISKFITPLLDNDFYKRSLTTTPPGCPRPNREELKELYAFFDMKRFKEEIIWLLKTFHAYGLKVNYCHNDFHSLNVIYNKKDESCALDNTDNTFVAPNGTVLPESEFKLLDFEYSGLNYRSFDFANSLMERCMFYTGPYPCFVVDTHTQIYGTLNPTYNGQEEETEKDRKNWTFTKYEQDLVNNYLEGYESLLNTIPLELQQKDTVNNNNIFVTGANKENFDKINVSETLIEASLLQLGSHILWSLWGIVMVDDATIEFGYLEYAVLRMMAYVKKKQILQEKGIIPK